MILLTPSNSGTFIASVPTAAQVTQASNWPIATIDLRLSDVNADGFVDVALLGLGNMISNAADQIVYAPGQTYTLAPLGVRKIDQHLKDFAADLTYFARDHNYFDNASVEVESYEWIVEWDCSWFWWGQSYEFECTQTLEQVEIVTEIFPGINSSAVSVWNKIKAVFGGQGTIQDVADIIENVIGVSLGGVKFCLEFGVDDDTPECLDLQVRHVVAALADDAGVEGTYSTREHDVVYLTKHNTWFFGIDHTALEYTDPIFKIQEVFSAAPNCELALCYGDTLKSGFRRPEDLHNDTVGIVVSQNPLESPFLLWLRVYDADSYYSDCAPYEGTPGFGGYNSNSYVAGMLNVIGAVPPVPMTNFVGGGRPLPENYLIENHPEIPNIYCP